MLGQQGIKILTLLFLSGFASLVFAEPVEISNNSGNLAFKKGWFAGLGLTVPWFSNTDVAIAQVVGGGAPNDTFYPASVKGSVLYELSTGYQFIGNDATFPAYRVGLLYQGGSAKVSGLARPISAPPDVTYGGHITTNSFFINGQLDLIDYRNFIPYIETGVGMASNQTSGYYYNSDQSGYYATTVPGASAINFAWLVGFGAGYRFDLYNRGFVVSLGYRYVNRGIAQTGVLHQVGGGGADSDKLSQSVRDAELGLNVRYMF